MRRLGLLALATALLAGCATVVVEAPLGKRVKLATMDTPTDFTRSKRVWYWFWGLAPLTDNSTADLVGDASEARVSTSYEVMDFVLGCIPAAFTVGCIFPQTVKVEGKR